MDSSASSSKANGQSVIVSEKKDDEVDQLTRALSRDFASFLQVDQSNEVSQLEEALENNLILLESFCHELEDIRANATDCLETYYPQLQAKAQEMQKVYARIDFLENVVKQVKETVDAMEIEMEKAERSLDTPSSVKKFFTSIFKTNSQVFPPKEATFRPPRFFKADDLFNSLPDDAHEVLESASIIQE